MIDTTTAAAPDTVEAVKGIGKIVRELARDPMTRQVLAALVATLLAGLGIKRGIKVNRERAAKHPGKGKGHGKHD